MGVGVKILIGGLLGAGGSQKRKKFNIQRTTILTLEPRTDCPWAHGDLLQKVINSLIHSFDRSMFENDCSWRSTTEGDEFYDSNEDEQFCAGRHDICEKKLLSKFIIHLDIDCFYCQCEEISNPSLAQKPVAIGQKHIVVTANYVARKLGIKKLMGRHEALKVCPSLIIIEGSDLEKYREASQQVYSEFRNAVKDFGEANASKKGSMDEMFADITFAVEKDFRNRKMGVEISLPEDTFIYGEDGKSSLVRISEDQSGAEAIIRNTVSSQSEIDDIWGSIEEREKCADKLQIALIIASHIRAKVRSRTQYSTTVGVSVSPLLAKLASDLKVRTRVELLFNSQIYCHY